MRSWTELNDKLREATEKDCADMLTKEKKTKSPRLQFLLRIYGRFNKLRTRRERRELIGGLK